jgi:hypothetical protein
MNVEKAIDIIESYNVDTINDYIDEITLKIIEEHDLEEKRLTHPMCMYGMEERRVENRRFLNRTLHDIWEIKIINLLPRTFIKHEKSFMLNYPKFMDIYKSLVKEEDSPQVNKYIHEVFPYLTKGTGILKVNDGFTTVANDYRKMLEEVAGDRWILMRDQSIFIDTSGDEHDKITEETLYKLNHYEISHLDKAYVSGVFYCGGFFLIDADGCICDENISG